MAGRFIAESSRSFRMICWELMSLNSESVRAISDTSIIRIRFLRLSTRAFRLVMNSFFLSTETGEAVSCEKTGDRGMMKRNENIRKLLIRDRKYILKIFSRGRKCQPQLKWYAITQVNCTVALMVLQARRPFFDGDVQIGRLYGV